MVDDSVLNKRFDKIKKTIGIVYIDNTTVLIATGDKFPDGFTLKNVVTLMTQAIKNDDEFYSQIFFYFLKFVPFLAFSLV